MLTIQEVSAAARLCGLSYGQYTSMVRTGLIAPVPIEDIRAAMAPKEQVREKKKRHINIICYDFGGEKVAEYPDVASAAEAVGARQYTIRSALRGTHKSACGFQWRWETAAPPGKYTTARPCKQEKDSAPKSYLTEVRECEYCGKPYKPNAQNQKYCSAECKAQKTKEYRAEHRPEPIKRFKTCPYCGLKFEARASHQTFCCKDHKIRYYNTKRYVKGKES